MSRYPELYFDKLKMYFGEPYVIDNPNTEGKITLLQPTIGDLIEIGEKEFFSTLNIFITNTTIYRSMLWDMNIDWNELSDFELWIMLVQGADSKVVNLLFKDIDFAKFQAYQKQKDDVVKIVFYNEEDNIEIDEDVYQCFHQYLQIAFNMQPEEEMTKDKMLKKWWVESDKRKADREKEKTNNSSIQSLISAYVNHPGTKYKLSELKEVNICQFYDSIKRLQIYESTTALMKGMYSGFISGKDLKPDDYNFMKEI